MSKSADEEAKSCFKCEEDFDGHKVIGCNGLYKQWFHLKCAGVKEKEFGVIQSCSGVKWYCKNCMVADDSFVSLREVKKIVNEAVEKYVTEIETIKKMFPKFMLDIDEKKYFGTNIKNSYADTVNNNPAMIIQPKADQQSTKTRKEVQQNIKPSDISVGVASVRNVRNGRIVVQCQKKGDVKKLETEVSRKLGDKYEVKISDLRNPQIKIVGISEKMSKEDIIESLRTQMRQ